MFVAGGCRLAFFASRRAEGERPAAWQLPFAVLYCHQAELVWGFRLHIPAPLLTWWPTPLFSWQPRRDWGLPETFLAQERPESHRAVSSSLGDRAGDKSPPPTRGIGKERIRRKWTHLEVIIWSKSHLLCQLLSSSVHRLAMAAWSTLKVFMDTPAVRSVKSR